MPNILVFALRKKPVNNCILFFRLHTPFLAKPKNWVTLSKSMWFRRAQHQASNCSQTHMSEHSLRSPGRHEGKLLSSKFRQVVFPYTSDRSIKCTGSWLTLGFNRCECSQVILWGTVPLNVIIWAKEKWPQKNGWTRKPFKRKQTAEYSANRFLKRQ